MADGAGPTGQAPDPKAALSWAFQEFRSHATAYAGLAAVVTVIQFLQQLAAQPLLVTLQNCLDVSTPGQRNACDDSLAGSLPASLGTLVLVLLAVVATAGVQRAALGGTRHVIPSGRQILAMHDLPRYVLYSLVYGIVVGLGLLLCLLPGLAAYVVLQLGFYSVLDRGTGVAASVRLSARFTMSNLGPAVTVAAVNLAALLLGGLFYGIPTLVTLPFACLFTAHMYRQYVQEPVW
ncbi:MAG: hypothetical protein IPO93_00800 [Actinobacteria bacterium]|jgi:hypothetical protein|nr:hypothetical protein [Actinomycetota bacterium]